MKTLNEIKQEKNEYIERQVKEEYTTINMADQESLKEMIETETKRIINKIKLVNVAKKQSKNIIK